MICWNNKLFFVQIKLTCVMLPALCLSIVSQPGLADYLTIWFAPGSSNRLTLNYIHILSNWDLAGIKTNLRPKMKPFSYSDHCQVYICKYIILSKTSQTIKSLPGLPSPPCRPCPAPGLLPSLSTNLYPSRAPILTSLPKILVLMFYSLRRNIITSSTLCYWPLHAERERREK